MHYQIHIAGQVYRLKLEKTPSQESRWLCRVQEREIELDVVQLDANTLSIVMGGRSFQARRENGADRQGIFIDGTPYELTIQDARSLKDRRQTAADSAGPLKLTAAMPGKVVRVLASPGDTVQAGKGIVVIEAMKMQNELRSPKDGTLKEVLAREGMNVNAGDVLAVLE